MFSLVLTASILAGCQHKPATTATTDPIAFPLYDGSTLIAVRNFTQTVDTSKLTADTGVFATGSGTYAGHQVIAGSDASSEQLQEWLDGERMNPPPGFADAPLNGDMDEALAQARSYGIDFAMFTQTDRGRTRGLLVLTMDPTLLDARIGAAMGVIDRYRSLPAILRDPVDSQLKTQFGMTGTQLLDPNAPLGAALSAYDDVKATHQRAIVLIDAQKQ